ncbi:MAG: hypothetical protein CL912_29485 [Deltaproteobacteria bacterium]|nr:hypothetical protein [Deltaproteobacteria bacterium]
MKSLNHPGPRRSKTVYGALEGGYGGVKKVATMPMRASLPDRSSISRTSLNLGMIKDSWENLSA